MRVLRNVNIVGIQWENRMREQGTRTEPGKLTEIEEEPVGEARKAYRM